MTVLYVLKRFPRLSETFVLHEILRLEAVGERVLVDALLEPEDEPRHPELDALRAEVRYVDRRPRLRQAPVLRVHARVAMRAPVRWVARAVEAKRHGRFRRFVQAGLVADRIRREGVEHVHAHFATAAAEVARDAGYLARRPVTVTAHAKDIFDVDNAPRLRERLDGVDAVVTVSHCNVAHLRSVLPAVTTVHHVPNGVPVAEAATDSRTSNVVLCVSRLVPKKGIDVLIDAFVPLARTHPDLVLEIAGSGPLLDALEARVHALGLGARVRLLGRLTSDDVARAYQRCAMVVLPCRVDERGDRDGMPTVLVEALARGVPVISTDVAGVPELVRDGDTGLLVPPDDPPALAAAIGRLADDRALAARLGAAGRTLVRDEFDPGTSTARLRAVFASCAPGGMR